MTAHTDTESSAAPTRRMPATTETATIAMPIHIRGSRHPGVRVRVAASGPPVPRELTGPS